MGTIAQQFLVCDQLNFVYSSDPQTMVREGLQGGTQDPSVLLQKKKTLFLLIGFC